MYECNRKGYSDMDCITESYVKCGTLVSDDDFDTVFTEFTSYAEVLVSKKELLAGFAEELVIFAEKLDDLVVTTQKLISNGTVSQGLKDDIRYLCTMDSLLLPRLCSLLKQAG